MKPIFPVFAAAILAAAPFGATASELPSPLDLHSAIVYALDHNFAIRQAREQVRLEEGIILQVSGQEYPNLGATGAYTRNAPAVSQSFPQSRDTWAVQVKATQVVFAGGGVRAGVRAARLTREAALEDLQTTINTALLEVRTRFYNVLLTREKVRVQEENIRLFQRQLSDVQNQFQAGSVSNFEVLRARVALANAQPDLITARNDNRIAQEQLRQALGLPAGPGGASPLPEVAGSLDFSSERYELANLLDTARDHRPELSGLHKRALAGEQSIVQARAGYLPNVSIFGTYEWQGAGGYVTSPGALSAFGITSGGTIHGWLFGAQSTWAIFDGRATEGRVRQARALLEQARLSEASQELAIDVEVRQAFSLFQQAHELVDASRQTVEQATEALRLASERFHVGSATQLDVLTSQVALTQAKTNEVQANYNYLVAVASLRKAVGLTDAVVGA